VAGKPRIYAPKAFKIPSYEKRILPNGLTAYILRGGSGGTLKFEWCFKAGRSVETTFLTSKICNSLIKEGSGKYTGYQIAEHFDYYGSSLSQNAGTDYNSYSFYCLNEHFEPLIDMYAHVILNPSFPENELEILKNNSISRLKQDLDDADFNAYRILTEEIFGSEHPYGYNSTEELIRNVGTDAIKDHWKNNYFTRDSFLILSGDINENVFKKIESSFSSIDLSQRSFDTMKSRQRQNLEIDKRELNKNQCSVKIGQNCISRSHDDYNSMFVFNTILGGYFNSRLSTVIREIKGLTYNIYSTHDTYLYDGLFFISADTSSEQIQKMLDKNVSGAELERVRSYLMGMLLTSFDGIYTCAETLRSSLVEGVTFDSLQSLIDTVAEIEPETIRLKANEHIDINNLIEVVIG